MWKAPKRTNMKFKCCLTTDRCNKLFEKEINNQDTLNPFAPLGTSSFVKCQSPGRLSFFFFFSIAAFVHGGGVAGAFRSHFDCGSWLPEPLSGCGCIWLVVAVLEGPASADPLLTSICADQGQKLRSRWREGLKEGVPVERTSVCRCCCLP